MILFERLCQILRSTQSTLKPEHFRSARWLCGGHMQTLYASGVLPIRIPPYRRTVWTGPDALKVNVDLINGQADRPVVVMRSMAVPGRRLVVHQFATLHWIFAQDKKHLPRFQVVKADASSHDKRHRSEGAAGIRPQAAFCSQRSGCNAQTVADSPVPDH